MNMQYNGNLWLLTLITFFLLNHCAPDRKSRPNIVFFLVDDLGWSDPGYTGNDYHHTPNIDRLAANGMVFTNAYANAPNCAPTRACLMSGQYGPRHGVYTVGSPERGQAALRKIIPAENTTELSADNVTPAEVFKSVGYVTASMGKWHLGDGATGPLAQGFDINIGGNRRGMPSSYFSPYDNPDIPDGPEGEHLTDRLADEAVEFIRQHSRHPFFLYMPFYSVHTPIEAKDLLIDHFEGKPCGRERCDPVYAAMLENTDRAIGKIISQIEVSGLSDRTLVVFFSDNGPYYPVSTADPLRGSKGMLYEGGIRVPMIVAMPGVIEAGQSCDVPVIGVDFYPTLLEFAGIAMPGGKILDGVSLVPLLEGGTIAERSLFWHFPAYLQRYGGMKQVWRQTPAGAIRQGDWKLIEYFEDGKIELFNLKEDVGESNDLSRSNTEQARKLKWMLQQWRGRVSAKVPAERNPAFDSAVFENTLIEINQ